MRTPLLEQSNTKMEGVPIKLHKSRLSKKQAKKDRQNTHVLISDRRSSDKGGEKKTGGGEYYGFGASRCQRTMYWYKFPHVCWLFDLPFRISVLWSRSSPMPKNDVLLRIHKCPLATCQNWLTCQKLCRSDFWESLPEAGLLDRLLETVICCIWILLCMNRFLHEMFIMRIFVYMYFGRCEGFPYMNC